VPQLTNLGYQMLSIDGTTHASHLDLAILAAPHFDLSTDQAHAIADELVDIVYRGWSTYARTAGVGAGLRKRLASCFQRQGELVGAMKSPG
jgi:hypothetical protein